MQWNTQAGNITTNMKVKIDFTLPEISVAKILTWNCHMNDSAKGRYGMILGIYLNTIRIKYIIIWKRYRKKMMEL